MDDRIHGFEPVLTLYPMAPDELLWFTTCNCHEIVATNGVAAKRVASSVSQHVETAKAFHARIASMIV